MSLRLHSYMLHNAATPPRYLGRIRCSEPGDRLLLQRARTGTCLMNRERHAVASTPSSSPARPRKASSSDFVFHPGRVCIKVDATKDDADDYVAFIESATLTNSDTAASTVLVAGRAHNSSYTTEAYAGAWFNDAHIGTDLTDDYVDYLTFFIDPELRPAEGATASLSLAITIAYHHVATGRRVLAERTSMPITMDAAGEDETVLDIGTTTPEHCASGDSSVDATLTFAGLAIDQWAPEPVLLAIKDAAGTVSEDQVRVNSVAREDDGAAVGVEISGVDEAGAEDIVDALVLDVSSADAASFSRLHRRRMGQLCTPSKRDRPAQADRSIFGS